MKKGDKGQIRERHIFKQFYALYKNIAVELEAYGSYVPSKDKIQDETYERQEAVLLDIQNEIVAYAAAHIIQTQEDAELMSSLWHQLITFDDDGCSQEANLIARNLFSYYQDSILLRDKAKTKGSEPAPA